VFKNLFRESGSPYLVNLASQLLERLDKVFIGLQTSSADLGRYSTNQSIFGFLKFFPDSISKLSIARNRNYVTKSPATKLRNLMIVFFIISLTQIVSELLRIILGPDWTIAWYLLVSVAVIEIMRGFHNIVTTNIVRLGEFVHFRQMTVMQIIVGVFVQPLSVYFLGVAGSIVINFCILAYGLILMRKYLYA
jgi:O-antigen/teichoic acid export membrane protein